MLFALGRCRLFTVYSCYGDSGRCSISTVVRVPCVRQRPPPSSHSSTDSIKSLRSIDVPSDLSTPKEKRRRRRTPISPTWPHGRACRNAASTCIPHSDQSSQRGFGKVTVTAILVTVIAHLRGLSLKGDTAHRRVPTPNRTNPLGARIRPKCGRGHHSASRVRRPPDASTWIREAVEACFSRKDGR